MAHEQVVVVGAGPGGLAVAAALRARGHDPLVLDRAPHVGSSWRRHYDRLHLHTPRGWSHLPGLRIPRRYGRWVARDDVVRYLDLIIVIGWLTVLAGVIVTVVDFSAGMPLMWSWSEGPPTVLAGLAYVWLARRAR